MILAGREFLISELLSVLEAGVAAARRLGDVGTAAQLSTLLIVADEQYQQQQFADPAPIYRPGNPFLRRIQRAIVPLEMDPGFVASVSDLGSMAVGSAKPGHPLLLVLGLGGLGAAAYLAWNLSQPRGR